MVLARFERDFTDDAGNLLTGNVTVEVRRMSGGLPQLYSDRAGASALGNPFVNSGGAVAFHVAGNAYRVTATQGAFSRELTYVGVGLAGETDFTFAQNQGEWSGATTYALGDYVVHNGVGIFISTQDSNLNNEPDDTTPASTAYWTYLPGLQGPAGAAGSGMDWQGAWVTATGYLEGDGVSKDGSSYICLVAHTSGTFATDLASLYWELIAAKGDTGATGANGTNGTNGADGADPGILLTWDVTNTDADPGTGKIRADNDALGSATVLYIDKANRGGSDIAAFLLALDDSTTTAKGVLTLTDPVTEDQVGWTVTGVTDATGYVKVAITGHFGETAVADTTPVSLQFMRTGDQGASGAGSGDMTAAVYDPQAIADDAFDRANHTGTQTASTISDFTTAADARVAAAVGSSVQAYAANLTEWATLNPSANAGSLVTAADYAAMRALLDLEAGTDFLSPAAVAAAYQPLDADLTTIAGLTATTDNFIVSVASAWASRTPAQVRATLDLEAGTDFYSIAAANAAFQPIDADLTSWAGVTRAAGFDTFAATPSSANLRALLSDESGTGIAYFVGGALGTPSSATLTNATGLPVSGITASTSTALGVGSVELGHATDTTLARSAAGVVTIEGVEVVTLSRAQTLTSKTLTDPAIVGAILEDVYTITDGAGFQIDPGNGSIQLITLTDNRTPAATNFAAGESVTLMIADGTGPYAITWTTVAVTWVGGSAPTLATSGYTVVELWKVGSTIYGAPVGDVA